MNSNIKHLKPKYLLFLCVTYIQICLKQFEFPFSLKSDTLYYSALGCWKAEFRNIIKLTKKRKRQDKYSYSLTFLFIPMTCYYKDTNAQRKWKLIVDSSQTFVLKGAWGKPDEMIRSLFWQSNITQNKRNLTQCKSDREAKFTNKVTMLAAKKFRECPQEEKSGLAYTDLCMHTL